LDVLGSSPLIQRDQLGPSAGSYCLDYGLPFPLLHLESLSDVILLTPFLFEPSRAEYGSGKGGRVIRDHVGIDQSFSGNVKTYADPSLTISPACHLPFAVFPD